MTIGEIREELGMVSVLTDKIRKEPFFKISESVADLKRKRVPYNFVDGYLEITILDNQGNLAGFLRSNHMEIIMHDKAENIKENWEIIDVIKKNGKYYKVLKSPPVAMIEVKDYKLQGGSGGNLSVVGQLEVMAFYAYHHMIPLVKGDTLIQQYIVYEPID